MLIAAILIVVLLVLTVAPFLLLTPRAPKPPAGIDSVAKLEAYLGALTANGTPPALQVTVLKDGAVAYTKAFGIADGPTNKPAATDQVYHFWSVTKLFTATAIMQLVESGKVGLDDPLTRYLPGFQTVSKSGMPADIAIRQLLAHTSGIKNLAPRHLFGWIHGLGEPAVGETALVKERLAPYMKLASEPGHAGAYSNTGYILLAAVVEAAAGESFEDYVRGHILAPLGMTSSDFVYRGDLLERAATGSHPLFHIFTPLLLLIHFDWFSHWVARVENRRMWLAPVYADYTGPTGLIGTGGDLARFGATFPAGGELDGKRILKAETVAMMLNEGYGGNDGPDGDRMGLGWHWWNDGPIPFKGHGGDGPGFSAQLAVFPDQRMVVVVLANDTLTDRVGLTKLVATVFR